MTKVEEIRDLASEAGFVRAAQKVDERIDFNRKLAIAYEHYRYVSEKTILDFNRNLQITTSKTVPYYDYRGTGTKKTHDELLFTNVENYEEMPPADVLNKLIEAKKHDIFDTFTVCSVKHVTTVKMPDPILFGTIKGCTDYFFIGEWGDDIKISDLLKENEG